MNPRILLPVRPVLPAPASFGVLLLALALAPVTLPEWVPAPLAGLTSSPLAAQVSMAEYQERRARFTAPDGDGITLAMGSTGGRQSHLSFQYLTGLVETDAVLLVERTGGAVASFLFVDPGDPDPMGADGRPVSESWSGPLAPEVHPLDRLEERLEAHLARHRVVTLVGPDDLRQDGGSGGAAIVQSILDRRAEAGSQGSGDAEIEIRRGNARVSQMRAVKSPAELQLIRRAVAITEEAHRALLAHIRPGITENDLKGVIDSVFAAHGADERHAFGHIVASAENSTILHYRGGDRVLGADEHVKIDIGAAYHGYAADVTRTYPVNGVFSDELRAIYQVVRDAQAAAEALAAEGAARSDMSRAADGILARGLAELGLIQGEDATWDCPVRGEPGSYRECSQLGLLYFHALGHGIGLNVHDPTPPETVPGSAISIEPGIYVRPGHLETLPDTPRNRALVAAVGAAWARYDGIGVRIEDDYVMTEEGLTWISRAPREIDEIEAAMRAARELREGR